MLLDFFLTPSIHVCLPRFASLREATTTLTQGDLVISDEKDELLVDKRVPNDGQLMLRELEPYREELAGVVVESTYNWYWLVDDLIDEGYRVHLAHPAGNECYRGLKHGDDRSDARWLAHLLRIGLLREGYILEPEHRAVRDLLRRRMHLVQKRADLLVSVNSLMQRATGFRPRRRQVRSVQEVPAWQRLREEQALAIEANLEVIAAFDQQIARLERALEGRLAPERDLELVRTAPGIGKVLGWCTLLETGPIDRFAKAGNYLSYCRCVPSERTSNGKRKGQGNRKNGNKYLGWAYLEAAHFAVRGYPEVRRYHQRKTSQSHPFAASKAVAAKIARGCYYALREKVAFDVERAFS